MTQEALAVQIGVHRFTVSKWEQGITKPAKPNDYRELANILDVDADWLREGTGEMGHYTQPVSDRENRNKLRGIMTRPENAPVDWAKVGNMVGMIHVIEPKITEEKLTKALRLLWVFAKRGQVELDQVRDVLASLD